MPVIAALGDEAVGVEPGHGAPGQRHGGALLVQEPRPVLHTGPVALDDRSAEAHVVDPLLVREGLGDVVANGLASSVGLAERGGAVHTVLGVQGDDRLDVMGLPGDRPGRRPSACRRLGVHLPSSRSARTGPQWLICSPAFRTTRSVAWCSMSTWSGPDGPGLLTLAASSVQTASVGSRRIVWMIIGMIKVHPTDNRMRSRSGMTERMTRPPRCGD